MGSVKHLLTRIFLATAPIRRPTSRDTATAAVRHRTPPRAKHRLRPARWLRGAAAISLQGFVLLALLPSSATPHPLAPALLELREYEPGRVAVLWRTPARLPRSLRTGFGPRLPASCQSAVPAVHTREGSGVSARWELRCSGSLASQEIGVQGTAASGAGALVRVQLFDGRRFQRLLGPDAETFRIPTRSSPRAVFLDYLRLGWKHIVSGTDHLLFVFALVLWVRNRRELFLAVTAFTLGHSVSLSAAALGWLTLPQRPVEALIALSIAALALELVRAERTTVSASPAPRTDQPRRPHRAPLLAAAFGLLHGLGFATALAEIGLAQSEIPLSLLSFNVGIELGQLAFLSLVLLAGLIVGRVAPSQARPRRVLRVASAYAIGSVSALWFYQRAFTGL
jgi:hydrogenase/urease accessory protein HupE